jgi:hypothetical protein
VQRRRDCRNSIKAQARDARERFHAKAQALNLAVGGHPKFSLGGRCVSWCSGSAPADLNVLVDEPTAPGLPVQSPGPADLRGGDLVNAAQHALVDRGPSLRPPSIAGVLIFINELLLTADEVAELKKQVVASPPDTDVLPQGADLEAISEWRRRDGRLELSEEYRLRRALRVISVTPDDISAGLGEFDTTVGHIESAVGKEASGIGLHQAWRGTPGEQTCAVCDWRSICPDVQPRFKGAPSAP